MTMKPAQTPVIVETPAILTPGYVERALAASARWPVPVFDRERLRNDPYADPLNVRELREAQGRSHD